jgi:hypothetical protein
MARISLQFSVFETAFLPSGRVKLSVGLNHSAFVQTASDELVFSRT